jgi:hypothetical protein
MARLLPHVRPALPAQSVRPSHLYRMRHLLNQLIFHSSDEVGNDLLHLRKTQVSEDS